ncbi:hypothetical protein MKEN_00069400 [Mycena kentingensis (nom. inval.)]|nr:hypothetical protein MKEN_00069400 [Mycena kentingensis (nom. inval.)]
MAFPAFLVAVLSFLRSVLFVRPEDSGWTTLGVWCLRVLTFALLLRRHISPWIVSRASRHLRIRSLSFRSVKGIYARLGKLGELRVERISWSYSYVEGSRRITLSVQGTTFRLGARPPAANPSPTTAARSLSPSPIGNRLWGLFASIYSLVDPFLRPLIRSCFAAVLRLVITWVPKLSQALALEIDAPVLTFADAPEAKIIISTVLVRSVLAFSQRAGKGEPKPPPPKLLAHSRSAYNLAAWRRRLTGSVQRSWDRAWGQTHGTATVHLQLQEIVGTSGDVSFFRLPGSISFDSSLDFSPRNGTVDPHSVDASLVLSDAQLDVRILVAVLGTLKKGSSVVAPTELPSEEMVSPVLAPVSPGMSFFSPLPPTTPRSPFLTAFAVSAISRRLARPCVKLKESTDKSLLVFLAQAKFCMSSISATISNDGGEAYKVVIRDIHLGTQMSDPEQTQLHRSCLGRRKTADPIDPQGYSCTFATGQVRVDRNTAVSQICLVSIRSTNLQGFATQWPTPWLHSSPFLAGDPNAAALAFSAHVGAINITERLDRLTVLFADQKPRAVVEDSPLAPLSPSDQGVPLPRLSIQVECDPVCARLIVGTKPVDPSALDFRTDGFVVSASTRYSARRSLRSSAATPPILSESIPLQLQGSLDVVLRPFFIRVCSRRSGATNSFLEDPVAFSMEAVELYGHGTAEASIGDDGEVAAVDVHSKILQLHCTTDAVCAELWHPLVTGTLTKILSTLPRKAPAPPSKSSGSIVDKLPSGAFASITLGRVVVLVTAPDINPDDSMDLARGFAARATGLAMEYCSLRSNPNRHADWRATTRQKLYLPAETLLPGVLAALRTNSAAIFVSLSVPDVALRSAISTPYDADDPLLAERDDPNLKSQEFLRIEGTHAVVGLSSGTFWPTVSMVDSCDLTVNVGHIHGTLQLAHVYSILLGIASVQHLANARPRSTPATRPLLFKATVNMRTVQVLCELPHQSAVLRLDGINSMISADQSAIIKWDRAIVWVKAQSWEEFLCLHKWTVTFNSGIIDIDGDNARIHVPNGFIVSDLILDISVFVKAARHLSRICLIGHYYPIPIPESEGPKQVPKLTLNVRSFIAEAADDPMESNLGLIFRTGLEAARNRKDREEGFAAKVESILAAETFAFARNPDNPDYRFDAQHSISIQEARERLDEVHSVDWGMRLRSARQRQNKDEESISRRHFGSQHIKVNRRVPNLVPVTPLPPTPPLIRILITNIALNIAPPSFAMKDLPKFLHEQGSGMPLDTKYSLLVPMHLNFGLASLRASLRDYPLPLVYIPPHEDKTLFVFDFDSDVVIAEEMGTNLSVDWIDCLVVASDYGLAEAAPFALSVPKTIMPVKSYANPIIEVTASAPTTFTWGVSYQPATQDLMRVVETLSSAPRDASPAMGFWDKMRLIFHWSIKADFAGEVRYQMKGLRDPYIVHGAGAGFAFAWQGNPRLLIGHTNHHKELIQVFSESMVIAIPDFSHLLPKTKRKRRREGEPDRSRAFKKICAKLRSGVCFGVGFVLERACGSECSSCSGSAFHRKCRFFDFRPHYQVQLEKKSRVPEVKTADDTYNGFRSDFIHLSTSLSSSLNARSGKQIQSSSFHLTAQVFTHFWSWWKLFDGVLSLPVRQGSAWPARHISPKFGRHLATLKYRISLKNLYIMHAYLDDTRETWADGVTPWIGVKGIIEEFKVDMHQREEEALVPGARPDTTKLIRRKPFYAVELVMRGLDLRAMLATFDDPVKIAVGVSAGTQRSNYRTRNDLPLTAVDSVWYDLDDFIELDWTPTSPPLLHLLPFVSCPRFTYFRRAASGPDQEGTSRFGIESTHTCFLGKQPSVLEVQIDIARARVAELQEMLNDHSQSDIDIVTMEKMLSLLQDYISLLQDTQNGSRTAGESGGHSYHIPADTLSEAEWAEFDNVYQIHCPKFFLDSAIRDIMMQYYYSSQTRRGVEYHMATRAVKFIRDQADQVSVVPASDKHKSLGTAQAAAQALKKILSGHERTSVEDSPEPDVTIGDNPLDGWFEGVSLRKGHCCLLLKSQFVLRDDWASENTCVVAAVQGKLQSYAIMDNANADDPISGKVMQRTFTSLSGLQTFSPASADYSGDGCVPLEVLIDFRCESKDFERLVPQTDATFHYDKFNRLRLRNNVTSVVRSNPAKPGIGAHNHLNDQTDLIQVEIPRFTVTAIDQHFQTISNIVAKLLLFSDAAHQTRTNKLETLLFTYDFNDLNSVANVVTDLQTNLRDAIDTEFFADIAHLTPEAAHLEMLKLKAHKMLLSEELGGLFECIALAQDQRDHHSEPKSALLLHTSSSEISWRMLDDQRELLAKLVVQNIDFFWLSRQDSSTVNNLTVGNLQAFDGSRDARWAEILSKHDEPANHPLLKRGLFVLANWSVLAPVGGITIYEAFELNFHPMRLQVDAKVGRRIMEYVWPGRKDRKFVAEEEAPPAIELPSSNVVLTRSSLDSPRTPAAKKATLSAPSLAPPMKLSASRSFTDLRSASLAPPSAPTLYRTASSGALRQASLPVTAPTPMKKKTLSNNSKVAQGAKKGDAAEMKTRSSQKSFVLVKISSLHLLLSVMKEESFVCRDAHIRTRDLEFRNQTWSFEELVGQFIPADMSWRGWIKMAFHQPLVPVLPVARELISKTKWIASNKDVHSPTPQKATRKAIMAANEDSAESDRHLLWRRRKKDTTTPTLVSGAAFTAEPGDDPAPSRPPSRPPSRNRKLTIFGRGKGKVANGVDV